ncbi:MAG: thrombospondin type 3 repeat-containing protein [Gammaproteobacteria bacterium]
MQRMGLKIGLAVVASGLFGSAAYAVDSDGDGVDDSVDNCSQQANADQRDSNGDGFGNVCDTDLNNDLIVNVVDLGIFRSVFFSGDADADANGDGTVNVVDLGVLRSQFFSAPGPGAVPPAGFGQRPASVDFDFDNNGLVDAQSVITYDDDGNVTSQTYTITGDGTPDLFNPVSDANFQADYTWEDGLLTLVEQDNITDGNDFVSAISYVDGVMTSTVESVFDAMGGLVAQVNIDYDYLDDLRVRDTWTFGPDNLPLLIIDHVYDGNGLIATSSWVNQLTPGGQEFDFTWNTDGKLTQRRTDADADGVFEEVIDIEHAGGVSTMRTVTGSLSFTPADYTETPAYDTDGRILRIDYDANIDGSIDAVGTPVWEEGPCQPFFLPTLNPTNESGFDGDPDSGVGDVLFCGP